MSTLLLVDDNHDTCTVMSIMLTRAGHRCLCAANAAEAEEKLADATPDVIVSDLMMPYESGIDLCTKVRADARLKDVPFIIFSAVSEQRYIDAAMDAGATDYWLKGSLTARDLDRRLRPYLPGGVGWADDLAAGRAHL